MLRVLSALTCALLLSGCGTTAVGLKYAPGGNVAAIRTSALPVSVGSFTDQRGEPANWLGAIRGGFGNPLKNLESDRPVSTLVQDAFAEGLKARGVKADPSASSYQITGVIKKLDCNQYVRREANAEIEVSVIARASGQVSFTRTYVASNIDGSAMSLSTGIFASVEDLRAVTEKTLRDVVDKALDDSALRAAMQL